jgi:hypothetical protein
LSYAAPPSDDVSDPPVDADCSIGDTELSDTAFEAFSLMMEFLHGSIVKEEADTYRIPAVLPVTESDLIEYCGKRMEESKLAQLIQVLARGTEPKEKSGRDIRLNKVLPIMIEELLVQPAVRSFDG